MKSAALELGEHQITVNTVEPGLVDTPLTRNPGRWKEALKEAGKEPKEHPTEEEVIAARLPMSVMKIPWMQPDEVAPAVVFLASDAANRVTGSELRRDGRRQRAVHGVTGRRQSLGGISAPAATGAAGCLEVL